MCPLIDFNVLPRNFQVATDVGSEVIFAVGGWDVATHVRVILRAVCSTDVHYCAFVSNGRPLPCYLPYPGLVEIHFQDFDFYGVCCVRSHFGVLHKF